MTTKIFISSVSKGLEEVRQQIATTISNLGHEPILFESHAFAKTQLSSMVQTCLKEVEKSDIYLLIIGDEVGYILEDIGRSVTHLELRKAISNNKKTLVFVQDYIKNYYFREFLRKFGELKQRNGANPNFQDVIDELGDHSVKTDVLKIIHDAYQHVPWLFSYNTVEDINSHVKSELSALLESYVVLINKKQISSIDAIILASQRFGQYDNFLDSMYPLITNIDISDMDEFLKKVQSNLKGGLVYMDEGANIQFEMIQVGNCEGTSLYKFDSANNCMQKISVSGLASGEETYPLSDDESYVSVTYNESQVGNGGLIRVFSTNRLLYICHVIGDYVFTIHLPIESMFIEEDLLQEHLDELYMGIMQIKANQDIMRFLSLLLNK